ncbi:MAG: alpha/beta hydrolase [Anaerolineales bacterium]|nr:alpha/beta hydrolase [Anaerolineales bacterium]MCX7755087.1 alpha/beta hydrolase [Anaerolineales bacterium]MDW8277560.1 alpha/beta hydrolase [Anaerolineales bacterium]
MPLANGIYYFAHEEENWARPAVVLLHGAGGNHLFWPPEIRHLPGQRIYALDLPGHGKSNGVGRQSVSEYAEAVLGFMDALKLRKAVFVGHSMGGAIALWLGIHRPARTLGLGLLATAPRLRVAPSLLEDTSNPVTAPLAVKTLVEWAFSPSAQERLKELAAKRLAEVRPSVLHGDFLACASYDETALLGRVKAPTLILCGTDDRMTPVFLSQAMRERIRGAMFHTIEGAGHMLMLEQPLVAARLLDVFLKTIDYRPGELLTV